MSRITKPSRSTRMINGHDLGQIALIMNALSAVAALGGDPALTLWVADYPDGEVAFREWAKANAHSYEIQESEQSPAIYIKRRATCELIATFRVDIPRHAAHPLAPWKAA